MIKIQHIFGAAGKKPLEKSKKHKYLKTSREYFIFFGSGAILLLVTVLSLPVPSTLTKDIAIPYTAHDVKTASLELGQSKTSQSGANGVGVTRERVVKPIFAYIFDFKKLSYSAASLPTKTLKQPVNEIISQGTTKYQYMWCSNGTYRYYTSAQFQNATIGFTHTSPDYCAENNQGKETELSDEPPTPSAPPSSSLINTSLLTVPDCTTTTIPYSTDYESVSWLPSGQTENFPGLNGTYFSCLGTTVSPVNEIVYTGTGVNYDTVDQEEAQQEAQEKCSAEYQSAMAQIDALGAGDSSAAVEVQQIYQECLDAAD